MFICAAAFFAAGAGLSLYSQPDIFDGLVWRAVAGVAAVGVPLTICLNAVEFRFVGRAIGQSMPFARSLEVTVLGTAANMLPLPGAALVRIAALKAGGARYIRGTAATLLAALIWIAVSLAYAGAWIAVISPGILSLLFMGGGAALLLICGVAAVRLKVGLGSACTIFLVRTALVLLDAGRLALCLIALNAGAGFAQASAFAAASALGSAVSIIPGGLGIREAATAALAPFIGVSVATGFLTATLNRLIGVPVLIPIALLMSLQSRHRMLHSGA